MKIYVAYKAHLIPVHVQVICCTLTGVQIKDLRDQFFDVAIVDEAAQALEVATWGALLKAPRVVLAGDHLQLPPTVISKAAEKGGLGRTLFERLQARIILIMMWHLPSWNVFLLCGASAVLMVRGCVADLPPEGILDDSLTSHWSSACG